MSRPAWHPRSSPPLAPPPEYFKPDFFNGIGGQQTMCFSAFFGDLFLGHRARSSIARNMARGTPIGLFTIPAAAICRTKAGA